MRSIVRRLAGIGLACLFAAAAVVSGLDRTSEYRPGVASSVPGAFRVSSARILGGEALTDKRLLPALAEARRAVQRDPVDARSSSLLGSVLLALGNEAGARAAFTVSSALGWRDPPTQLYWMAEAFDRGDLKVASQRLDALLRQNPVFPQGQQFLAQFGATPQGRTELVDRLADTPVWRRNYFLDFTDTTPESLTHRAQVAVGLARKTGTPECALVAPLTHALAANRRFAEATQVRLAHCLGSYGNSYLADGDFAHALPSSPLTAFDWTFPESGEIGILLAPAAGFAGKALSINSAAPRESAFATQLLVLPQGRYALSWRALTTAGEPAAVVSPSVACDPASRRPLNAEIQDRRSGRFAGSFAVPPDCPAQWLTFWMAPGSEPATIDDVAIAAPADGPFAQ